MEKDTEEEASAKVVEQIASMTISADTKMVNQQGCAGATSDPGLEEVIFIF